MDNKRKSKSNTGDSSPAATKQDARLREQDLVNDPNFPEYFSQQSVGGDVEIQKEDVSNKDLLLAINNLAKGLQDVNNRVQRLERRQPWVSEKVDNVVTGHEDVKCDYVEEEEEDEWQLNMRSLSNNRNDKTPRPARRKSSLITNFLTAQKHRYYQDGDLYEENMYPLGPEDSDTGAGVAMASKSQQKAPKKSTENKLMAEVKASVNAVQTNVLVTRQEKECRARIHEFKLSKVSRAIVTLSNQ